MTLHHAPEPINTANGWLPHCLCSWRDPDRISQEYLAALNCCMDHISRCPESWGEGVK